jgi:hypothetical protein
MNEIKARHNGFFESRTWHKVRWKKGKHEGKFDLFTDEDLEKHNDEVNVITAFKTEKCATGVPFSFGKTTEQQIDEWININKR